MKKKLIGTLGITTAAVAAFMFFSKNDNEITKNDIGKNDSIAKIDSSGIAFRDSSKDAKYITVASWNMKNFGLDKLRDAPKINVIINVVHKYDVIAMLEIKDVTLVLADELVQKVNKDGYNYKYVISKRLGPTNQEQYLILYDSKVQALKNTEGYGYEPNNEFKREPYYCEFKAGNFDFYLMTIHTDPDEVKTEIPALKTAYTKLQESTPQENDIILMGDLNAKAPGVTCGSYIAMTSLAEIPQMYFCIREETNTRGGRALDNILFQENYTTEFANEAGVLKFWTEFSMTADQGFGISDHCPVWAKFKISEKDDD